MTDAPRPGDASRACRARDGLPPTIEDEATLDRIAALLLLPLNTPIHDDRSGDAAKG